MKCPACGNVIDEARFSADLTYCPHCGQDIKSSADASRLQFCPYCGQKLESLTNFCPNCGKKLVIDKKPAGQLTNVSFIERTAKPIAKAIRNTFGHERQIRKLYQQWAEYSDLPQEEIPSIDDLRGMSSSEKEGEQNSNQDD